MRLFVNGFLLFSLMSCSSPAPETGEKSPRNTKELFHGRWSVHAMEGQQPDGSLNIRSVQHRYEFRGDTLYLMPFMADPTLGINWIKK